VYRFLGRASLYREDYRRAQEHFQRACADRPDDPFILEGLGESLWRGGQMAQAVEILHQALSLADQGDLVDRRTTIRLKLARILMELRQYQDAVPYIQQCMVLGNLPVTEFQALLSQCYLALGRYGEALQAAEAALHENQTLVEAHTVRAAALFELKKFQASAEAAETALKLDPTSYSPSAPRRKH
jgi:tetratricopeptide (TPR) repeat protein